LTVGAELEKLQVESGGVVAAFTILNDTVLLKPNRGFTEIEKIATPPARIALKGGAAESVKSEKLRLSGRLVDCEPLVPVTLKL
jgi:hypothetical protein